MFVNDNVVIYIKVKNNEKIIKSMKNNNKCSYKYITALTL